MVLEDEYLIYCSSNTLLLHIVSYNFNYVSLPLDTYSCNVKCMCVTVNQNFLHLMILEPVFNISITLHNTNVILDVIFR